MKTYDVIVVGGGAAGFFAAINIAEQNPNLNIAILERGKQGLQKVKVSGGGRCNVTHAEFIPSELIRNYPRGEKELLGPFHQFMTGDTIAWFQKRDVELKIEDDGRMFPVTNSSQTIIDCFLREAKKHKVDLLYNQSVKQIEIIATDAARIEVDGSQRIANFQLQTNQDAFASEQLVLATGSNARIWTLLKSLGHTIIEPVPSLFTFNITDERIKDIPGVVAKDVEVKLVDSHLCSEGPLLITHVGMSAPAILKLSAFGALELAKCAYKFQIEINFIRKSYEDCLGQLNLLKVKLAKKTMSTSAQFDLPKRLWKKLILASNISNDTRWADVKKSQLELLSGQLTRALFKVTGKSTFKEEFVTAGGVNLKEVNFKTYESKICKHLYFAGEILNIDAVTGGFNFQNAWTGAYIAAKAIAHS